LGDERRCPDEIGLSYFTSSLLFALDHAVELGQEFNLRGPENASTTGWLCGVIEGLPSAGCAYQAVCKREPPITYRPGGVWGGIYWWPPGCGETGTPAAWDRVRSGICSINLLEAGNLTTVNHLAFQARGEQGGETIEFKIGASDILPSPGRSLGKITLTGDWITHTIDLEGADLTSAVGLFAWVASDLDNLEGAVFYLDDIQFEGVR
jgi:hypothetical protein